MIMKVEILFLFANSMNTLLEPKETLTKAALIPKELHSSNNPGRLTS